MDPVAIVKDFLDALENRDLSRAQAHLGPGFGMVFPGGRTYGSLEAFVAGAKGRYAWVRKRHDPVDVAPSGAETVVYIYGTLYGAWLDDTAFEGIRYIDRFVLRDGKIIDQLVWNDLAEARTRLASEKAA
ncbi:MAG: nuclear transport factor 2 family protein [Methylobacteriaceae bacterium]|nr:nuclear transport factor 2 family protein [Methylobacteriaceae bacterium]